MSNKLLIVESPNKVNTIQKYLGDDYKVMSSVGHILKMSTTRGEYRLGIDFENWEPIMSIDAAKSAVIKDLKEAVKDADEVLVATDPDREGEAIAQNLVNILKVENKYKRIKYNEITKEAIENAIKNPLEIDQNLVKAQKTRRMLDRIIGFKLSNLMKEKIKNAPTIPSAGRVQSIALKLVCDREKLIQNFIPVLYSKIEASLSDGPIAVFYYPENKDFDNDNTWIRPDKIESLFETISKNKILEVINKKNSSRKEPQIIPFKQSILYKEAKYSSQVVQSAAQNLFETGLISYPRTDSTRLSASFITKAKSYITEKYGKEYVANEIKGFSGDQDAHEAIRPTDIYLTPLEAKEKYNLSDVNFNVYTLIYNHTLCALMTVPVRQIYSYELLNYSDHINSFFRMSFSKVTFDGYYKVLGYEEDKNIPEYEIGQKLDVKEYIREDKETQPPARYNDGSLIKMLDDIKVGRPSTFATTVSLIKKRLFVTTVNNSLHPTTFGMLVNEKLISGFPETITEEYTAQVEEKLDEISEGKIDYKNLMEEFWNKFNNHLANATETIEISVLPQELVNEKCPNCGSELIYRYTKAKKQKFIGCSNFPACHYVRNIDGSEAKFKKRFWKKSAKK
ncbi:type I DNA topoisomerase [Metamycoplasma salivarium]|uniref:type I DNA topoisomerase n=1 Tax=Metamycoplasma salivarium TaxID=2124 RepID=UPI0035BC91FD